MPLRRREGDTDDENGHTRRAPDWRGALVKISIWITGLASAMGGQYAFHEYDRSQDARQPSSYVHDYTEVTKIAEVVSDLNIKVATLIAKLDERLPEMRDQINSNEDRIRQLEIIVARAEARRASHNGGGMP